MALRNAALEQLGHKIREEEIITISAKAEGEEAVTWAAKCAYSKLPSLSKWKSKRVVTSVTVTCSSCSAVIRKERAEELARVGMGNTATRQEAQPGSALAILSSETKVEKTRLMSDIEQYVEQYSTSVIH